MKQIEHFLNGINGSNLANTVKQFMQESTAEQIYVNSRARLLFVWIESRKHKGVIKG